MIARCSIWGIGGLPVGRLTRELRPYILGIFLVLMLIAYLPIVSLIVPNLIMGK